MSEELEAKKRHLEALTTFMRSPAYAGYKAALKTDIETTVDLVIATEPNSWENFVREVKLRGELDCLQSRLTLFEDARDALETRIDEMVEAELQVAENTKK